MGIQPLPREIISLSDFETERFSVETSAADLPAPAGVDCPLAGAFLDLLFRQPLITTHVSKQNTKTKKDIFLIKLLNVMISPVYPHTFAESHGCKAVDKCSYSLAQARNRQSHTCKGVEVYFYSFFSSFIKKPRPLSRPMPKSLNRSSPLSCSKLSPAATIPQPAEYLSYTLSISHTTGISCPE